MLRVIPSLGRPTNSLAPVARRAGRARISTARLSTSVPASTTTAAARRIRATNTSNAHPSSHHLRLPSSSSSIPRTRSLSVQASTSTQPYPPHPQPQPPLRSSTSTSPSSSTSLLETHQHTLSLVQDLASLFERGSPLFQDAAWAKRLRDAAARVQGVREGSRALRIGVIGSSDSGVEDLVDALLDEPMGKPIHLRERRLAASATATEASDSTSAKRESRPLLFRYGNDLESPAPRYTVLLPLGWMEEANVEILEVKDPRLSASTLDELYSCDALLFVISSSRLNGLGIASHALTSTGQAPLSGVSPSRLDTTLHLLSHFSDKPGTRLLLNRPSFSSSSNVVGDLAEEVGQLSSAHESLASVLGLEVRSTLTRQAKASGDVDALMAVSASLASEANESLKRALEEPGATRGPAESARLWDHFSNGYERSNVGRVRGWIERPRLSLPDEEKGKGERGEAVVLQSAEVVLRHALGEAVASLGAAREEIRRAEGVARVLEVQAEEGVAGLKESILPGWKTGVVRGGREEVEEGNVDGLAVEGDEGQKRDGASILEKMKKLWPSKELRTRAGDRSDSTVGVLADSQGLVEETLSRRLPWWKLGVRVDDVRAEVEAAVGRSFAKDLETKLIFEAGNLPSVALASTERTERALSELSTPLRPSSDSLQTTTTATAKSSSSPFASAILLNSIAAEALRRGSSIRISPQVLSRPISARREQLLRSGGALDALAARAQSTMLGSTALLGGVGLGSLLCGAMGHEVLSVAFPQSLVQTFAMSPSNATALAVLASVVAAWRTQGRWGKAKVRFWKDWHRLAAGLEDDLERNLDEVLRSNVFGPALIASEALRASVEEREEELREMARVVESLQERIEVNEEGGRGMGGPREE